MPYEKEISRDTPGCIIFLLDQSGSMSENFGGTEMSKAEGAADAIQRLLLELIIQATKDPDTGIPRHYYDIAILGYTTSDLGATRVASAFEGNLKGKGPLIPIQEIFGNQLRLEDRPASLLGQEGETLKIPIYIEPKAEYGTPMCAVLEEARRLTEGWAANNPKSFPPIVINITDGEFTDGDPAEPARRLREISTSDGNVLLFNMDICSIGGKTVIFPSSEDDLGDESTIAPEHVDALAAAKALFRMSSELPDLMRKNGTAQGLQIEEGARGMAFQATGTHLLMLLDIGTKLKLV